MQYAQEKEIGRKGNSPPSILPNSLQFHFLPVTSRVVATRAIGSVKNTPAIQVFRTGSALKALIMIGRSIRMVAVRDMKTVDDPGKFRAHIDRQAAFVRDTYMWQAAGAGGGAVGGDASVSTAARRGGIGPRSFVRPAASPLSGHFLAIPDLFPRLGLWSWSGRCANLMPRVRGKS